MTITSNVQLQVTPDDIRNTLCTALEGGSNYWYRIIGHDYPTGITRRDFLDGGKFTNLTDYFHPDEIIPTIEGCATLVGTLDHDYSYPVWVNLSSLYHGFTLLPPDVISEWIDSEGAIDADTADTWFQLCIFGQVIYG